MRAVVGALVGLLAGAGGLLAREAAHARRRSSLAVRLEPYLGVTPITAAVVPWAGRLARLLGGEEELARHLRAAGRTETAVAFRARQAIVWAATAGVVAVALAVLGVLGAAVSPTGGMVTVVAVGGVAPVVMQVRVRLAAGRRRLAVEVELPAVAGLLSLCLSAGESLRSAIGRVSQVAPGVLGSELRQVNTDADGGMPLSDALEAMVARVDVVAARRMVDSLQLARERGVPVAGQLRAQAGDLRAEAGRRLIEAAGQRQVLMLIPVVFLILPVCVLFAFWPALESLRLLSQ